MISAPQARIHGLENQAPTRLDMPTLAAAYYRVSLTGGHEGRQEQDAIDNKYEVDPISYRR